MTPRPRMWTDDEVRASLVEQLAAQGKPVVLDRVVLEKAARLITAGLLELVAACPSPPHPTAAPPSAPVAAGAPRPITGAPALSSTAGRPRPVPETQGEGVSVAGRGRSDP